MHKWRKTLVSAGQVVAILLWAGASMILGNMAAEGDWRREPLAFTLLLAFDLLMLATWFGLGIWAERRSREVGLRVRR
ncbi:MAG: hypothetical protein NTW19_12820 [Planctomycetota bacterium]|nr:hypothetical protein [Planctomycetota bacterium]